jgi:hypothetical protein
MTKLRLISIAAAILVAGLVGSVLIQPSQGRVYMPRTMTNQDPAFVIEEVRITEGTNHVYLRGSPLMGRINMWWMNNGRNPLSRALPPFTVTTTQDTVVLWVNVRGKRGAWRLAALLTEPEGETKLIQSPQGGPNRMDDGYFGAWVLPSHATNFPGWWLHIVTTPDGERVASFEL